MTPIEVLSVTGGPYELIGAAIKKGGQEDSSGLRRAVVNELARRNYVGAMKLLDCSEQEAEDLRATLVTALGEPA